MHQQLLSAELRQRVLDRLELSAAPVSIEGLRAVYGAWCATVPFDNTAKLIALRTGVAGNLPGIDTTEFFERFLAHGAGGTCWPSSNALFALLRDLGFEARRVAGSMRDTGFIGHGSVKVTIDGSDWLADSSMLTRVPLPLTPEIFMTEHPVFAIEVEPAEGSHVIWWDLPPNPAHIPCRLIADHVSYDYYVERYAASRERSPFNERLYVRRNVGESVLVLHGNRRLLKTASSLDDRILSRSELEDSLRYDLQLSEEMIQALRDCGAIEVSLLPSKAPPPPPITTLPPSKRNQEALHDSQAQVR